MPDQKSVERHIVPWITQGDWWDISRNHVFATNFNILIPISFQSSVIEHYSFNRRKYFHLLIAPSKGFISLIG